MCALSSACLPTRRLFLIGGIFSVSSKFASAQKREEPAHACANRLFSPPPPNHTRDAGIDAYDHHHSAPPIPRLSSPTPLNARARHWTCGDATHEHPLVAPQLRHL